MKSFERRWKCECCRFWCCFLPCVRSRLLRTACNRSSSAASVGLFPGSGGYFPVRELRINFGKHRGKTLGSLPDDYLRWIAYTLQDGRWSLWADRAKYVLGERNEIASTQRGIFRVGDGDDVLSSNDGWQDGRGRVCGSLRGRECTSVSLRHDCGEEQLQAAMDRLGRMDVHVDSAVCAWLLKCCGDTKALRYGKHLHAYIIRAGYDDNRFLGNLLVQMYGKCGFPVDARGVFDKITQRNVFSWNIMIQTYAENGLVEDARCVFEEMPERNVFSWNAMIAAYSQNGRLEDARDLFDNMPQRDIVSWNAMITAYSQNGDGKEALQLFRQMQLKGVLPDKVTFISTLDACAGLEALPDGKEIHFRIIDTGLESDIVVGTALVNMYGKCGSFDDARRVFDKMRQRNVVSWNAMITVYSQNGHGEKSLQLFRQMQLKGVVPDKVTFIGILNACADLSALAEGKESHASIIESGLESNVVVGNALIHMYGKCGTLDDAKHVFENMPQCNVVSWTAMIAAYKQNGSGKDALELFKQMQLEGVESDWITLVSVLDACSALAALAEGMEIHLVILVRGFDSDVSVGNALVNMYGKCGSLEVARHIFDKMPKRNVFSWSIMIAAYSQNGHCKDGLKLFQQMQLEGVTPDRITFISILSGCSHAGLLDDGWCYFVRMNRDYGITPMVEHLMCMVDLLGRAGQLDEAEELINNMSFGPSAAAWMNLLGACRIHGDVERGTCAAEHVFELDPGNAAAFVLLSNIYAAAGKWDDVANVRRAMKDRDVKKQPGHSCIEVKNKIHKFLVGDASHSQKEEIYAELQRLTRQMEDAGYLPDTRAALHDVEEANKEHMLYYHSEKLAIAFGLISTVPGTPICISKNLRVCSDCHAATKLISKIVMRKIIVRDANCFHYFNHGVCSCGDYW